jgi:hypothetical protein
VLNNTVDEIYQSINVLEQMNKISDMSKLIYWNKSEQLDNSLHINQSENIIQNS